MAARPWAAFGSREKFEELLLVIHAEKPEAIQALKENAEAEVLLEAMGMKVK